MLKRVMCAKMVYGKNINVGIVDSIKTEFIRESFDFDVRRLGDKATQLVLIADNQVFYTAPANHDAEMLAKFVDSRGRNGTVNVQSPIPYPVNEITIFWEYLKKDLT